MIKLILFSLILLPSMLTAQGGWSTFRGDRELTGYLPTPLPSSMQVEWVYETNQELKVSPVAYDGRIVIGTMDGQVICISTNGDKLWEFETGNGIEGAALIHNGMVYVGNLTGMLYALSLKSGEKVWEYETHGQISAAPSWWTDGDRTLILVGSYDYYLHAVDAVTGQVVWKYELDNYLNGSVAVEGNLAVFGGCDGMLHVVDIATGKGQSPVEVATYIASSPSLSKGKAFMGDYDGKFSSINYRDGSVDWTWEPESGKHPFVASAAVSGSRVVIGKRDRFVYCFHAHSGELLWRTNTGAMVDASPIADSHKALVVNTRGDMMLLSLTDGSRIWTYELGSSVFGNPAFIDGRIVVATQDGSVYCLVEGMRD